VEGNADAAWNHFEKVPEKIKSENLPMFKAKMLLSRGSFEEAYQIVSQMLAENPSNTDLQLMQSEAMAGMGAWEALLPHLNSFGEGLRARAGYWHLKGLANKYFDNMGQCREDFEQAAWMESFNVQYAIDAGLACIDLGEYGRSEHHFRAALKLDPRNEDALLNMAESREAHCDIAAARSFLRECLVHHPDCQKASEMLLRLDAN
jgi:tetratricopeptide (TPR) repeat protein